MYTVGSLLPIDGVDPGSTLLVVGPPMTGKRALTLKLLSRGFDDGGVAMVSTDESAAEIRSALAGYAGRPGAELPLGVVDCVGDSRGSEGLKTLDSRVSSPADLTGIGMELTTLLERLYKNTQGRLRFGLLSLTTMSMYAAPEQVVRFLHVIVNRISDADGLGLVVAHSDTMDPEHLQQLRSFVDGVIEVRENDGRSELRVRGLSGVTTDWTDFEIGKQAVDVSETSPAETTAAETTPAVPADDVEIADSLRAIFDSVRAESPTLTICNYDGEPGELAVVETYFDRQGIEVRQASLNVDQPQSIALLHHGDDLLASESVTSLRAAMDIDSASDEEVGTRQTSGLLSNLEQSVFGAEAASRPLLIDVSHTIELLANRVGTGRLHAGFQELSNLVDYKQAARIYEQLANSGVDVHIYGVPDTEKTLPGVTIHEEDIPEIRESWFVVYDGAGDPEKRGALLALERESGDEFEGFWTYDSEITAQIDAYLTETYLQTPAINN